MGQDYKEAIVSPIYANNYPMGAFHRIAPEGLDHLRPPRLLQGNLDNAVLPAAYFDRNGASDICETVH
jgi:hypothetical protein